MIKPIGQRVLVERVQSEKQTSGGIYLPDSAIQKPQDAIVRALGTGGRDNDGKPIPFSVAVNDKVIISKYGGTEVNVDGVAYLILHENDILAISTPTTEQ